MTGPVKDGWAGRRALASVEGQGASNAAWVLAHGMASFDEKLKEKARRRALESARVALRVSQGIYKLAYTRWRTATEDLLSARFRIKGRAIVGLGCDSVLETGITLHRVYGVPVIPGSALKGLCAHYCDEVWGKDNTAFLAGRKDGIHRLLFGGTDSSGFVSFHDGWMVPEDLSGGKTGLLLDVMTPHHPRWPQEAAKPPFDTDDPTPVSFVSMAGTFRVVVEIHLESGPDKVQMEEMAMRLLEQALERWGIGGKTSSGYGRMKKVG